MLSTSTTENKHLLGKMMTYATGECGHKNPSICHDHILRWGSEEEIGGRAIFLQESGNKNPKRNKNSF